MPPLPSGAHSRRSCNLAPPTAQCRNGARRAEAAAGHDRRAGRREPDVAAAASELAQRMALEAGAAQAPPPLPPARRSSVPSPAGPRAAQPAAACTGPARADAAGPSHKRPRPAEQSNGGAGPGLQLKRSRLAVNAMLQADGAAARGGVASPRASDHRGPASPRAAGGSRGAPAVQPLKRSRWAGDQAPPARGASAGANDRAGVASPRAEAGQNAALFRALGGAPAARAPAGPATQRARCVVRQRRPVCRLLPDSMSAIQHCRHARERWPGLLQSSRSASCFAAVVGAPDALDAGGACADLLWNAPWVAFAARQPCAFTALARKQWDRDQQRKSCGAPRPGPARRTALRGGPCRRTRSCARSGTRARRLPPRRLGPLLRWGARPARTASARRPALRPRSRRGPRLARPRTLQPQAGRAARARARRLRQRRRPRRRARGPPRSRSRRTGRRPRAQRRGCSPRRRSPQGCSPQGCSPRRCSPRRARGAARARTRAWLPSSGGCLRTWRRARTSG